VIFALLALEDLDGTAEQLAATIALTGAVQHRGARLHRPAARAPVRDPEPRTPDRVT
jgi:hypothetical protein